MVRKLANVHGQSGSGAYCDLETWLPDRIDLNLLTASNRVGGSLSDAFALPFNAPGYTGTRPLKGLCLRNVSYLTFYNPIVTGYTSYPGTGRVLGMADIAGFTHTSALLWVEQQFVRGTHQVASVVRKTTGKTHTVEAVAEPVMAITASNDTNEQITVPLHGLVSNDQVTLTGTLPTGFALATTYYVIVVDANTIQLSLAAGPGAAVNFTGSFVGGAVNLAAPALGGSRLKIASATPWTTPGPVGEEEFTHAIKVTATTSGTAEAELNVNYGVRRKTTAKLTGLQLRRVTDGQVRIIDTWNSTTRRATCVNKVGLATQVWTTLNAGDTVVIEPQNGQPFDRYAYFLPVCFFEADLSVAVLDKTNPYMPGFDYPGWFHSPQLYGTDQQAPVAVAGTIGLYRLTVPAFVPWHLGFLARLAEYYGEEVWCIGTDFGGTSASHFEQSIGTTNLGWYDQAQQTDWSPGRPNGCYRRWLDEQDAGVAAAALQGETLLAVGHFRNQGFADATSYSDPTYGSSAAQSGISADKFYATNKTLRRLMRQAVADRGMWPTGLPASEQPFVQPLEQEESADLAIIGDADLLLKVNSAMRRLDAEDDFAELWDQTGLETWDGIHLRGSELATAETRTMEAFLRILRRSARTGEVEVCNDALRAIGEAGLVTSIRPADSSTEARICAALFDRARDDVLASRNWGFATTRRAGQPVPSTTPVWEFAFVKPSDCVRLIKVLPKDAVDDEIVSPRTRGHLSTDLPPIVLGASAAKHEEEEQEDGTRVVHCNIEEVSLKFVRRHTAVADWPAKAREALVLMLAGRVGAEITRGVEGAKLRRDFELLAYQKIQDAAEHDASEYENPPVHVPSWLQAMD